MVYHAGNLRFYLSALEEECRKIHVFRRELPLCYQVITQTIEVWKQKMVVKDGVMECDLALSDDQNSPEKPLVEEFIPVGDKTNSEERNGVQSQRKMDEEKKNSEWLRSAQLWNPIPDLNAREDEEDDSRARPFISADPLKPIDQHQTERQEHQGSSHHEKLTLFPADSSTSGGGLGNSQRKQRRCWSTELHRRFLNALEELGGHHVATPKQIKEQMKVDGLTNDEIKSHLQKYRLHTKLIPPPTHKIYVPVATIPKASSSAHTITIP